MSDDPNAAFDHNILEQEIKNIVAAFDSQSPSTELRDSRPDLCRTFVVTTRLHAGGPVRMRSYRTPTDDPFPAFIWQVARATSAAPAYFLPIEIHDVLYGDGGMGWNNPTKEAIAEAQNIWPNRPIGILVSIGTGLEKALQLGDASNATAVVQSLLQNTSPGLAFKFGIAEYAVQCLASCELVHLEIVEHPDRVILEGNYFRLNVPQGMSEIGLAEWTKLREMKALTNQYMDNGDKRREKRRIAALLRDPQQTGRCSNKVYFLTMV
jgi:hypothetical protein